MCLGMLDGLVFFSLLLVIGGIGAAVQHPLASTMVSKAYNNNGRRVALGTYNFSGDIGKFLFPTMAALALPQINWRLVCVGFGLVGCMVAVTLFFILRSTDVGISVSKIHLRTFTTNGTTER